MYESPYSAEVIGIPGVDNEPPVTTITIGQPQYSAGDNLYINGSTLIGFSAIDYGIIPSGVNYTEYKIDDGSWIRYTNPFDLIQYPDGQHAIRYRSVDNVNNIEAEKALTVILDKTPPITTITASDPLIEGDINTVSPNTRFFLNAADNLSGVKGISYSIDSGQWLDYLAGFTLFGAGSHTIAYKAIDNLGNEEMGNTLTVKLISLKVTKGIPIEPIVLVGAWGSTPSTQTALNNLVAILSASGLSYFIPQTNDEFETYLRQGRYNTYLLVDFNTAGLVDELREAVNYGDGLVFIKTIPDTIPSLQDVFGVKFNGMSTNKDLIVNLPTSQISPATALQSTGKVVKTTITSTTAQSLGTVTDKNGTYPVMVSNTYGRGKAILFAFDLLNSTDQGKISSLIINSIKYVTPTEHYTHALGDAPISININNSTEPADVQVTETIPANTSADAFTPSAAQTGSTIQWQLSLGASEKKTLGYWLNLPDLTGDYQLGTELRYSNQGNYRLYGNYSLTLSINLNSADLLKQIIAALQSLSVTGSDADHVNTALYDLSLIKNYTGITKTDVQNNINDILNALKEIEKVSVDVSAIRLNLDELLKIWQTKWNLATE